MMSSLGRFADLGAVECTSPKRLFASESMTLSFTFARPVRPSRWEVTDVPDGGQGEEEIVSR